MSPPRGEYLILKGNNGFSGLVPSLVHVYCDHAAVVLESEFIGHQSLRLDTILFHQLHGDLKRMEKLSFVTDYAIPINTFNGLKFQQERYRIELHIFAYAHDT